MRPVYAALSISLLLTTVAGAQPMGGDTDAGARPGNVIGTGMSLPRSDQAGNLNGATTHSELAPNLPAPLADDVRDLLAEAKRDLITHRTGAAQEALERAETRALARSIPAGTERVPDQSPLVSATARARAALGQGDEQRAIQIITDALSQP